MSPEERLLQAHDLGISALLGDTIYNFGELVRHLVHVVKIVIECKHSLCTRYWGRWMARHTSGSRSFCSHSMKEALAGSKRWHPYFHAR